MEVAHLSFSAALQTSLHNSCMSPGKHLKVDPVAVLSGERIKSCREQRGWSRPELAKRTGWVEEKPSQGQKNALSASRIGNFEQGTRRVGIEEAEILARVLEMPPPYFMGVVTEQEAAVLSAMRQSGWSPFAKTPASPAQAKRPATVEPRPR